jgi:Neprosin/Neprosin activation peptide
MDTPIRFEDFIKQTKHARHDEKLAYANVAGPDEFERMRAHILALYDGIQVPHSYVNAAGQVIDCVPIHQQPSLRRDDGTWEKVATPPARPGPTAKPAAAKDQPDGATPGEIPNQCPPGTIPILRITLEQMARFGTLENFFKKRPPRSPETLAPAVTGTHRYAHAAQTVNNYGGSTILNIWQPVPTDGNFSLSQCWFVGTNGATGDPNLQTAEAGWQVFPSKYGTNAPCLFIYWTADNYGSTGAYNLDQPGFVQTNATWTLGGALPNVSSPGGTQYEIQVEWLRDLATGNWYLYVGTPPNAPQSIGYYPQSLYNNGYMASNANVIDFGGEVTGDSSGQMGSGQNAAAGNGQAAYQRIISFIAMDGTSTWGNLTGYQPTAPNYTVIVSNATTSSDPNLETYIYFGGPSYP